MRAGKSRVQGAERENRLHTARRFQPPALEYITPKTSEQHASLTSGGPELAEIISMKPLRPQIEGVLLQLTGTNLEVKLT